MGHCGNLRVFNFAILLKTRKLDAREIFMFYRLLIVLKFIWFQNGVQFWGILVYTTIASSFDFNPLMHDTVVEHAL